MSSNSHLAYLQELPPTWLRIPIESLGNVFSGGTPGRNEPSFWGGSIAWLTPSELLELEGKYVTDTREHITASGLANSSAKLLPQGTIVVTTRATIGSIAIAALQLCTNQGFKNIVLDEFNDSLFYYYVLSLIAPEMRRLASGSTFAEISKHDFVRIIVPQPDFTEQEYIANVLDTIDLQILHTEQLIAKLKLQREGLLHDLLTRGLDEHGQLRDPAAHPEQFKDSVLGKIPKDWDIQTLASFAQDTSIAFVNGPFGSDLLAKELRSEGVPVIYIRDIKVGAYERTSKVFVSIQKADSLSFCNVQYGDVLIAKVGDPPCVATPYLLHERAIITQDVIRIRVKKDVNAHFLSNLLNSSLSKRAVEMITIAGTRKRVSLTDFKNILLPKPSYEEQIKIIQNLDILDTNIHAEEAHRDKLKLYKQGLMQDLLTGRVRVSTEESLPDAYQATL